MNALWVYAHPDSQSLNGALREGGIEHLRKTGHTIVESDLYAMKWKTVADGRDFADHHPDDPIRYGPQSAEAYAAGTLADDITTEQRKLTDADVIVLQFPLWWYSCPAILKGWFDRVFTKGFAYGVMDPTDPGRTLRYGHGPLESKRALLIVTAGGREAALGPRGVNGHIDDILFPIQHGTLWYTGISVLEPLIFHGANRVDTGTFQMFQSRLRDRLDTLQSATPIKFRYQNDGDYDADLVLCDSLAPNETGLGIHTIRTDA